MRCMRTMVTMLVAALVGCATGPGGQADISPRPAERAECQVASANQPAPPGQLDSLAYQRCHPGERLEWSSDRNDTIKPEFGGRRDE